MSSSYKRKWLQEFEKDSDALIVEYALVEFWQGHRAPALSCLLRFFEEVKGGVRD